MSIPFANFETHLISTVKHYLDLKQTYSLYFKTPQISARFHKTVQMYFRNASFKFVKCNILLTDVITSEDQTDKIKYHHEGKTCHKGINEMKASLSRNWYWPNMLEDITNYVNNCKTCQVAKYERNPPVIKFNLTPTSNKPFDHVHLDVFKILNNSFLTIILFL